MYSSLGRIIYFLLLFAVSGISFRLAAGEVQAVQFEREAEQFERKSRLELDPDKKEYFSSLAKSRREDAARERQAHYQSKQTTKIIDDEQKSKKSKTFIQSENDFLDGTWEVSTFLGAGSLNSFGGDELLGNSSNLGVTDTTISKRNSLSYDNIPYYNNQGSASRYAIRPIGLKLRYTNNEDKYGFQIDVRSFHMDTSFLGWNFFTNNLGTQAIQDSKYYWMESKINYFYLEEFIHNQSIELIFGIRNQGSLIQEKATLPYSSNYREYKELSNALGLNIGLAYKKNFYGVFIFTAGAEIAALGGILEYDSLVLRGQPTRFGTETPGFSKMTMNNPINFSMSVIELYAKYDFLLGESNRIGIGFTNIQSNRISTWDQSLPFIVSNDQNQLAEDYKNFILRNIIYNQESQSLESRNMNVRYIQLELTHVF